MGEPVVFRETRFRTTGDVQLTKLSGIHPTQRDDGPWHRWPRSCVVTEKSCSQGPVVTKKASWCMGIFGVAAAIACNQWPVAANPDARVGGMISEDPTRSVPIRSFEARTLGVQTWRVATIPLDADGRFDPRAATASAVVCVDDANAWTSNECVTIGRMLLTRFDVRDTDGTFVITGFVDPEAPRPLEPVEIVCRAPSKNVDGHMSCASVDRAVGVLLATTKPQRGHLLVDALKSMVPVSGAHDEEIVAPHVVVLERDAEVDPSTKPRDRGELAVSYSHHGGEQFWARTFRLGIPVAEVVEASFVSPKELLIGYRAHPQASVSRVIVELVPNTLAVRVRETRPTRAATSERQAWQTTSGKGVR